MDARLKAIRKHDKVGEGTCTTIDEAWTDEEIIEELDKRDIKDAKDAVKWAVEQEGIVLEQGLNTRWGSDDDPQLLKYWRFYD